MISVFDFYHNTYVDWSRFDFMVSRLAEVSLCDTLKMVPTVVVIRIIPADFPILF